MSRDHRYMVKVVEKCRVSPVAGSVPETSLPLTFFDVPWLLIRPMQRLYFYPLSQTHDQSVIVRSLKSSLSLALRHFFPLAGNLVSPPLPEIPWIHFSDGDSLAFTVAESTEDFDSLFADCPRDVKKLHSLVPDLAPASVDGDTRSEPLMAMQVTVFPDKGITIGIVFRHVVNDGRSLHHFIKYWASICKKNQEVATTAPIPIPFHDRSAINDPNGLDLKLLKDWWALSSSQKENAAPANDLHRITLVLGRSQIEWLKRWIIQRAQSGTRDSPDEGHGLIISSIVIVFALLWVCMIKSRETGNKDYKHKSCHLVFVADCRGRLEFLVPTTYFGNCLTLCFVQLKISELIGENGIVFAAKAIAKRISELGKRGYLSDAENWVSKWKHVANSGEHIISAAGSAKLGMYDTDFGFGKPIRTEAVMVNTLNLISVAENRDDNVGGAEVGLAMSSETLSTFNAILEQSLKVDVN